MKLIYSLLKLLILTFLILLWRTQDGFVKVEGRNFTLNGERYTYLGANYWAGMNLGAPMNGNYVRLTSDLDLLQSNGVKNLRIMGSTQGPDYKPYRITPSLEYEWGRYNEDIWEGLDLFLYEMGKRDMKAVIPFNNYWGWSGGFDQIIEWFYGENQNDTEIFYFREKIIKHYDEFIHLIVNRKNTAYLRYEGRTVYYKDDPTIMAWQLANEPRSLNCKKWADWISGRSQLLKSLDSNHIVSIGTEGTITPWQKYGNEVSTIDYITVHAWAQNWGWYSPRTREGFDQGVKRVQEYISENIKENQNISKPIVMEEFGLARDGLSFDPKATVHIRDDYYKAVFDEVLKRTQEGIMAGVNFWAFGGKGRPRGNGDLMWKPGDDFIGDPPHEPQGWYSVYDTDHSTLELIKQYAQKFEEVQ